ncbi:MAG: hypothetical protein IPK82_24025 [Polyangiaceae bacterium]|nr:hypothetical protein [Polyangiaceae bacterium]
MRTQFGVSGHEQRGGEEATILAALDFEFSNNRSIGASSIQASHRHPLQRPSRFLATGIRPPPTTSPDRHVSFRGGAKKA